jgi:hypothetical protein
MLRNIVDSKVNLPWTCYQGMFLLYHRVDPFLDELQSNQTFQKFDWCLFLWWLYVGKCDETRQRCIECEAFWALAYLLYDVITDAIHNSCSKNLFFVTHAPYHYRPTTQRQLRMKARYEQNISQMRPTRLPSKCRRH